MVSVINGGDRLRAAINAAVRQATLDGRPEALAPLQAVIKVRACRHSQSTVLEDPRAPLFTSPHCLGFFKRNHGNDLLRCTQVCQRPNGTCPVLDEGAASQCIPSYWHVLLLTQGWVAHKDVTNTLNSSLYEGGEIKDSASEDVRRARARINTLKNRLKGLLQNQAGEATEQGGRVCLAVPAQDANRPGCMLLGAAPGVAYIEPAAAVPHNNELEIARSEVRAVASCCLPDLIRFCMAPAVQAHMLCQRRLHCCTCVLQRGHRVACTSEGESKGRGTVA